MGNTCVQVCGGACRDTQGCVGACRECEGLQACRNLHMLGVIGGALFAQVLNYVKVNFAIFAESKVKHKNFAKLNSNALCPSNIYICLNLIS